MKFVFFLASYFFVVSAQAQQQFQLAAPFIRYKTIFFDEALSVPLVFEQPGAVIRYSVDQSVPGEKSQPYKKPISIKHTTTIKARAFSRGFHPSEIEEVTFIKNGIPLIVDFQPPNQLYAGTGINTLTDNIGGVTEHTSKTWLGYNTDSVSIIIKPNDRAVLQELLFNTLQNQAGWIFHPSKALIYIKNETGTNWQPLQTITIPTHKNDAILCKAFRISLGHIKASQLKLVLFNTILPTWHQGAHSNGWIFIDEIKVY